MVLAATTALLGYRSREQSAAQDARGEALAAAQRNAAVVLSYDHRSLDRDFSRAKAVITGSFAKD